MTVNGRVVGTLSRHYEPSEPYSCVAVSGARIVATVSPGTVTYSARSNTGATWSGTTQVSEGGCIEMRLQCTNRDCSPAPAPAPAPAPPPSGNLGGTYYVWGGPDYRQYLGSFSCTFCNEYGSESINNRYGSYGSPYSTTSMRNSYSQYGSPYSPYSACNNLAQSPPRVYNASGSTYYGELTVNPYRPQRLSNLVSWLIQDVCKS